MKRRDFLKYSSLILPASAAIGIINPFTKKIFAAANRADSFSLSVITDRPSTTIHTIEQAIKYSEYGKSNLQFNEYKLLGGHIGDIAYVKSQKLVDYHRGADEFSMLLDNSAKSLSFPRVIENPTLLRFTLQQKVLEPSNINIFIGDTLFKQLPLDKDVDNYRIEGLKGNVELRIKNKSASIVSATCKHKTCMNMEPISNPGENLICIPNQINISIAGKNTFGVDSITF